MTTTLLTFLGRAPKSENGYRKTSYEFDDGSRSEPVAFFGWPLQKRISAERLIIMGTSGSMWDHILANEANLRNTLKNLLTQLLGPQRKRGA